MPRLPVDYSKTIIYKIVCDDLPDYIYIGHTTDFTRRKSEHKRKLKTIECKLYKTIQENGGWENWKMIEIEEFACENGRQAEKREQYYMDLFKSNLNSHKAFGGETKQEYIKQYQLEHKEHIQQYRLEHKEQKKQYYLEHKEEIADKKKEKFTCECGTIVTKQCLTRHKKSQKHLDFVSSI